MFRALGMLLVTLSLSASAQPRVWNAKQHATTELGNEEVSGVFQAAVEAVEEAVYNSLFMATTVTGSGRTVDAIPLDKVREILAAHGVKEVPRDR